MHNSDTRNALLVAYGWIAILLLATWFVGNLPYGVLAVFPLLIIVVYGRRLVAVVTALILGPLEVYVDHVVPARFTLPSGVDYAVTLTVVLAGVIFIADALRKHGQYFDLRLSRAEQDAVRDPVTHLPNRRAFEKELRKALDAHRDAGKIAVLFTDLNGFKDVNDTLGHDVGDKALAAAGARLAHVLRDTDFVARLGGDEFGVIVPGITDLRDVDHILDSITRAFNSPFNINLKILRMGISIGVSVYPDDGTTEKELLARADDRMYAAKRSHKMVIRRGDIEILSDPTT